MVAADADVDVRRHVHEMADTRRERCETLGGIHRGSRRTRVAVQMNPIVMRPRMVRRQPHRAIEQRDDA